MSRLGRALRTVSRALHDRERLDIGLRAHGQPGARWWESRAVLKARFEAAFRAEEARSAPKAYTTQEQLDRDFGVGMVSMPADPGPTIYVPPRPCSACDATGRDRAGEACADCGGCGGFYYR